MDRANINTELRPLRVRELLPIWRVLLAASMIVMATGCRIWEESGSSLGRPLLKPASTAPDSATMEIFWVRLELADRSDLDAIWKHIDENQLPASLRRELHANGIRAGVIGSRMPSMLANLLDLEGKDGGEEGSVKQLKDDLVQGDKGLGQELLSEPIVRRRLRQLASGQRMELQASDIVTELPLLIADGNGLGGRTFRDAQAMYALEVDPNSNGTTRVELTPEVHHGHPKLRWTGEDGILRQAPLRDREVLADLRMRAELAPGEMLVVGPLANCGSRLGACFHRVDPRHDRGEKLILVRVAAIPEQPHYD